MFGLEPSLAHAINAVAGGLIGAAVSLYGAWRIGRRQLRHLRTLTKYVDMALEAENVEIKHEDGDARLHYVMTAEPGSYGVSGKDAATGTGRDREEPRE